VRRAGLSNREARWLAIAAQGLAASRPALNSKRPRAARLNGVIDQVGTIQLDAVNAVERTQFLVPFSRIGAYDPAVLRGFTGPGGPWFEYWGHAASLLPVRLHPLFRWRMERWRNDLVDSAPVQASRRAWRDAHRDYMAAVLQEVTERGPLAASQLSDPRRRSGEWWARRSDGRRALELLFGDGDLAAWRSPTFERVYDLTERVIPPAALAQPAPPAEDAQRELILLAARCMGVATLADLADYFWIRPGLTRLRVAELVEEGRLIPLAVEGWTGSAYCLPNTRPRPPRREGGTLLSPFDSLIWARARTERLFRFRYRIEIYVPEHRRVHGYYVMPLLLGDQLVARFDLKADRKAAVLRVAGAYLEERADRAAVVDAATTELDNIRDWLRLEHILVGARGNLVSALRKAVATGARRVTAERRPSHPAMRRRGRETGIQ
jgi:uncharacterized protein